ncbi:MAG: tRNA 2-thiouridine(34) synthase MnmA [Candidatus Nanoarchaeia archaeon]|nr:tRNA 2-thiouridine(34) synthase MnmA [Candidatus Nanoarchaeia archaeon]
MKPQKVLVAMSGGVDSSVAAMLMKKKGYEVIGVFMKNWSDTKNELGECSWREERRMAMKIASSLNIPLMTLDLEKKYRKEVVEEMFKKYRKGITPNPDIDCNKKIKFPELIRFAKKLGADKVVTGHYARIKKIKINEKNKNPALNKKRDDNKKEYKLLRAKDESKDQSYFLYTLTQDELKHSLFPIGDYTKKKIRKIAKKAGFPNFDKKSTVGICFIGKINLKDFLSKKIKPKKGKILNPDGDIIGEHDGIYYYTIGQRLGPRYGFEIDRRDEECKNLKKWYVASKNAKKNIIIAAPEGHPLLYRKEITLTQPHWINKAPKRGDKIFSRIRQVGELIPSTIKGNKIILNKAITGVSEGQAIVLYKGEEVLGGGVIKF